MCEELTVFLSLKYRFGAGDVEQGDGDLLQKLDQPSRVSGRWRANRMEQTPSFALCPQSMPVVFICLPKLTFLVEYAREANG